MIAADGIGGQVVIGHVGVAVIGASPTVTAVKDFAITESCQYAKKLLSSVTILSSLSISYSSY